MGARGDTADKIDAVALELEELQREQTLAKADLVDDLEDDAGLIFPLPANSRIVRIIRGYDTRTTTRKKVRCAACRQHQPHNRGFRVEIEGGQEARIGFNCGEDHFGEGAWLTAVIEYDRRVEHAQYVARIKPALDAIGLIMPMVREWHERTNEFGKWISNFRRELPDLFARLTDIARLREGRFERERRRKIKRVDRLGRESLFSTTETVVIGRIPYPAMFLGASPNHGLNGAMNNLAIAVALLEHKTDTVSLARAYSQIRQARQHLVEAAEIHLGVLLNLSPAWLPSLCDWANHDDALRGTYEIDGSVIEHRGQRSAVRLQFVDRSRIGTPSIDRINEFWP